MAKDETIALVKQRYDIASKNQKTKFEKFNDYDFIFNNKLKRYDPSIPARVFNPIIWSFIETIITRMLAKTPTVQYKPREDGDIAQSQIFSDLFTYWFEKCQIFPKIETIVKNSLIHGTAVAKIDWYASKPRIVKSYVIDMNGQPTLDPTTGQYITQETSVVDYDDPRLTPINIYDFFVDPNATNIEEANWVIHQYWANISDLEQENQKAGESGKRVYSKYNLDRIKREKQGNYSQYEEQRKQSTGLDSSTSNDATVDRCLIWEMWENDRLVVIADGMTVIRDEANPYWHGRKPFLYLVDSIVPHEFWGTGEIEPIEKLLHALNTTQNQRITNVNRILSPMWKAKPTVDDDELNFIDNGIIHVTDLQDADVIQMPDVTSKAYQEAETIKEDMQRALGVTDYVQGLQTPNQTAAEVDTKTAQANARFAHKVKLFEEMALKQLGEFVYQLYQQYLTKERAVRIVGQAGEQYVTVTPQDIVGEYDVVPESQSTLATDSEAEFQKFFNLFQVLRTYAQHQIPAGIDPKTGQMTPPQTIGFLNEQELVTELLRRSGEKDPQKFFAQQGGQFGQGQADQASGGATAVQPPVAGAMPVASMAGLQPQNQGGM